MTLTFKNMLEFQWIKESTCMCNVVFFFSLKALLRNLCIWESGNTELNAVLSQWREKLRDWAQNRKEGPWNYKGGSDLLSAVEKYCILFNPLRFSGLGKFCTGAASQQFSGKCGTRLSWSHGTKTLKQGVMVQIICNERDENLRNIQRCKQCSCEGPGLTGHMLTGCSGSKI